MRPLLHSKLVSMLIVPISLICILLPGCVDQPVAPKSIKIGLITYKNDALTQQMGIPTLNAAQMAVNEINSAGGIKIGTQMVPVELVIKSINSSPQEAVAATRELTNRDNVIAIVGPQNSSEAIPAGAFAEKAHVPLISPMSTNRKTTQNRSYVFRMSFVDDFQGRVMARFSRDDLQAKTAAILYDESDPYSHGVAHIFIKAFHDLGGKVVAIESFLSESNDFLPQLKRIKQQNADVLLLPNFAEVAKKQVIQARRIGISAHPLGCDGWDETLMAKLPEFSGAFMSTHWSPDVNNKRSYLFTQKYRELHNEEPVATAALTYDAVKLLLIAMEKTGSVDSDNLRAAITTLGAIDGVTGTVNFSKGGDPDKSVVILEFVGQNVKFLKQVDPNQ